MSEAHWLMLAVLLSLAGMSWLALAMAVHWEQVMPRPARDAHGPRRILRGLGTAALSLSLPVCLQADHATMAVLVWVMLLAVSAALTAFMLAWRPRVLRLFWPC